jgi:hypothetical protein
MAIADRPLFDFGANGSEFWRGKERCPNEEDCQEPRSMLVGMIATVRRVSPAKYENTDGGRRVVTTLIGPAGPNREFARSSAKAFRMALRLALHVSSSARAVAAADPDRDVGRLFVSCRDGVHAFDLMEGEHKHFAFDPLGNITGLAVTDDGGRLFAVTRGTVLLVDAHSGAVTALTSPSSPGASSRPSDVQLSFGRGCVLDAATGSLLICDYNANTIVRARGVDV